MNAEQQTQLKVCTEAIKVAQYLAMLSIRQDAWAEIAGVMRTFMGVDCVVFGEHTAKGTTILHHWTGGDKWQEAAFPANIITEGVDETLASGFLSLRTVESLEPFSFVFLPLSMLRQDSAAMVVGQQGRLPPKYLLDIYLSLSSIISGVLTRLLTEKQTVHLNDVLRSVREVNRLIARETDPQRLLNEACALLTRKGRYRMAWGILLDAQEHPSSAVVSGRDSSAEIIRKCLESGRLTNCCRAGISQDKWSLIGDDALFCVQCPMATLAHPRATMIFPVRHQNTSYGVLVIAGNRDDPPRLEEQAILTEMCADLAVGLAHLNSEKARLLAEKELKHDQLHLEEMVATRTHELELFNQVVDTSLASASVGPWWIDFQENDTVHCLDATARMLGIPTSPSPDKAYSLSLILTRIRETGRKRPEYASLIDESYEQFQGTVAGTLRVFQKNYPYLMPDQTLKWFESRTSVRARDGDGRALFMTGTFIDITKLKQAEEELASYKLHLEELVFARTTELHLSAERLHLATKAASIGIWDWDVTRNELVWDDSMYRLYGIARADFGGAYEAWAAALHPDDKAYAEGEIQAALRGEREYAPEFRIKWPDGSIHHLKATSQTLRAPNGTALRMIGTTVDITDIRQSESALREKEARIRTLLDESEQGRRALLSILEDARMAEEEVRKLNAELEQRIEARTSELAAANKELEAFSYSVSHDLRAPLRHVAGFVQLLQNHAQSLNDPKINRYTGIIAGAANKMGTLIDDLLSFSRAGRAQMHTEAITLNELVTDCRHELEHDIGTRNIEWTIPDLPTVYADRALLRQVFANLLGNAVKYSRPRKLATISVSAVIEPTRTVICVRDNGAGFDMKYTDKLFGVFQRLHSESEFEGTGIGLANVKRIITRHGGTVWAEGEPDNGAAFYFSLPNQPGVTE